VDPIHVCVDRRKDHTFMGSLTVDPNERGGISHQSREAHQREA